jgi:hypothetical protein
VSEAELLQVSLETLSQLDGVFVWRNNTGAALDRRTGRFVRFGVPGGADILGCAHGAPIALELKSQRGRQTHEQQVFQRAFERGGGLYRVVRTLEEALQVVEDARCR